MENTSPCSAGPQQLQQQGESGSQTREEWSYIKVGGRGAAESMQQQQVQQQQQLASISKLQ